MDDSSEASRSQTRLRRLTAAILAVGLGSAVAVYFVARPEAENPLGDPMQSKMYLHDLELYGGKANVLAAEFREWFTELWIGRNLAYTIAVLTVLTVLALRFVASIHVPAPVDEPENAAPPDRRRGLKVIAGNREDPRRQDER